MKLKMIREVNDDFKNIVLQYRRNTGAKFIPVHGKKPLIKWKQFENEEQTLNDIISINWNSETTGIAILHEEKFIALDFDRCENEQFVLQLARELSVDSYIVRTGSGFHIHLELDNPKQLYELIGKKSVYDLRPKDKTLLDRLEIRVNKGYTVLPPSLHKSGTKYQFIKGTPDDEMQIVAASLLVDTLKKHFLFKDETKQEKLNEAENVEELLNGVSRGQRHKSLVTLFGIYFSRGFNKNFIVKHLEQWNKRNTPPIDDKELYYQIGSLWKQYGKGLDRVFHQFPNSLLAMDCPLELKLKKILCYSVREYGSEDRLIYKLDLTEKINEYYVECSNFADRYESKSQSKNQILRIGEQMILSVLNGELSYEIFSVYCGVVSYLGRGNKASKQISNRIIAYRAIGYKNEQDYKKFAAGQKPLSDYKIRKSIKILEDKLNFIRTFKLRGSDMTWYSTKIDTKEKLANYVATVNKNKIKRKMDEEQLRINKLDEIINYKENLRKLKEEVIERERLSLIPC